MRPHNWAQCVTTLRVLACCLRVLGLWPVQPERSVPGTRLGVQGGALCGGWCFVPGNSIHPRVSGFLP